MELAAPRLRVFAGPNGSGKSTIKTELREEWLGTYVNADEIEKLIRQDGFVDLGAFGLSGEHGQKMAEQFKKSTRVAKAGWEGNGNEFSVSGLHVGANEAVADSYFSAEVADYIRHRLLDQGTSFTFETVMSFHDKVDFMVEAQRRGYRTYLYFVATEDPAINVGRVVERIRHGGHPVDESVIRRRYDRSIDLLASAVRAANRAYIFDNSGDEHELIAEVTDGRELTLNVEAVPGWFINSSLWREFAADE